MNRVILADLEVVTWEIKIYEEKDGFYSSFMIIAKNGNGDVIITRNWDDWRKGLISTMTSLYILEKTGVESE